MAIQWFPGHMHKARLQIQETLPKVDLVIEILDARIPFSSENPMLAELRGNKPCLKLLGKSDLADPELTSIWQQHWDQGGGLRARAVTTENPGQIRRLSEVCIDMLPHKKESGNPITTMIVGIPNVGKSTLINILSSRKIAKTGNEPAVTKAQQRVSMGNGIYLLDTPGVLWPNVENEPSGFRLAATGAIRETAMEHADVAHFAVKYLMQAYPVALAERYKIETLPDDAVAIMDLIGKARGCLAARGMIDYDRVARIVLTELRSGKLGRVTLETPEMMLVELEQVKQRQAERNEKDRQRAGKRRSARKRRP